MIAAALAVAVLGRDAHAQTPGSVLVTGTAGDHERGIVEAAISNRVRDAAWSVVARPFSQEEVKSIVDCLADDRPWPCIDPTARSKGVEQLLIRVGGSARRYRVRIVPGGDTVLRINWYTDVAFVVSREWLGFVWPVGSREELPGLVRRIVKQNPIHGVIVLGIVRRGGHRYITARTFWSVTGESADGVSIELGNREDVKIKALVSFLAVGERSSEILPLVHELDPVASAPIRPARWPMWTAAATAIGAFVVGGYFLSTDGSCRDPECVETRHTATWGWSAIGIGATALTFSAYWYIRSHPKSGATEPVLGLQPRSSGGLLTLRGWF